MGLSVAECDAMIAAAKKSGRMLMVAHVLRFWPEYVAIVEFLKTGALGKPLSATAKRLVGPPRWATSSCIPSGRAVGCLTCTSTTWTPSTGCFGTPKTVYSAASAAGRPGDGTSLDARRLWLCQGFRRGQRLQAPEYPFTMGLAVLCERGSVEFTFRAGGVQVDSRDAGAPACWCMRRASRRDRWCTRPVTVTSTRPPHSWHVYAPAVLPTDGTAEQGRLAVATALAARQSIETGQVVTL